MVKWYAIPWPPGLSVRKKVMVPNILFQETDKKLAYFEHKFGSHKTRSIDLKSEAIRFGRGPSGQVESEGYTFLNKTDFIDYLATASVLSRCSVVNLRNFEQFLYRIIIRSVVR